MQFVFSSVVSERYHPPGAMVILEFDALFSRPASGVCAVFILHHVMIVIEKHTHTIHSPCVQLQLLGGRVAGSMRCVLSSGHIRPNGVRLVLYRDLSQTTRIYFNMFRLKPLQRTKRDALAMPESHSVDQREL